MYEYTPEHILRSLSGEDYESARSENEMCRFAVIVTEYIRGNPYESRELPVHFASEEEAVEYAKEWNAENPDYQTSVWERK